MSGTVRTGLVFGLGAVGAMIGSSLLALLNPAFGCLSFISIIALGLGAGYTAPKVTMATREQRIGRAATAGAIAAGVVLVLGAIAVIVLSLLPFYQAAIDQQLQNQLQQAFEQDPALRDQQAELTEMFSSMATGFGVIGGICSGLLNGIVMLLMSLLGALFWKGAPAAAYVPAGGSAVPGQFYSPTDQPYGTPTQPYRDPGDPGGARVYDSNDPNRPQ
ncbi:MAG TPA: hypothetical protein VGD58_18685 [Herpetosiphonaceae bacterium]